MSETELISYCSPTLAGLKTGSLFTTPITDLSRLRNELNRVNKLTAPRGIRVIPLRQHRNRLLVYVYRPDFLRRDMSRKEATDLLQSLGYDPCNPERSVVMLSKHLQNKEDFPHEIGLFLGYPPEDVKGFIDHHGEQYKYSGMWKVYGDVAKAKSLFDIYRKCDQSYSRQWQKGCTLNHLIVNTTLKS